MNTAESLADSTDVFLSSSSDLSDWIEEKILSWQLLLDDSDFDKQTRAAFPFLKLTTSFYFIWFSIDKATSFLFKDLLEFLDTSHH